MALLLGASVAGCGGDAGRSAIFDFDHISAPQVSAVSPSSGASDVPTNTRAITSAFTRSMDAATLNAASFTLECPDGSTVPGGSVSYQEPGHVATLTLPPVDLPATTVCTATVTTAAKDAEGTGLENDFVWTFTTGGGPDMIAPVVTSTIPAPAASGVATNTNVTASFSEPMDPLTLTTSSFSLACPTGTGITGTVGYAPGNNAATFSPQAANLPAGTICTATVTTAARDAAGNPMASPVSWDFTTGAIEDVTAPTVTSTVPAPNAVNVALNTRVVANFSEAMDPLTINNATVSLECPSGTPISGTVTYSANNKAATLDPTADLSPGVACLAIISTGARDTAGNSLASPHAWEFTTGAGADTTPPTVLSTNPADLAVDVCPGANVNATFSEAMDPQTLNTMTFTLNVTGPPPVSVLQGTVAYASSTRVATLNPSSDLVDGTEYTATLTTGVKDAAGNALTTSEVWTFTAGPESAGCTSQAQSASVDLGLAAPFGGLGGSAGTTNQGTLTVINGDLATTAASTAVTGFHDAGPGCTYTETPSNIGTVNGKIYTAAPPPTVDCPTEGTAETFAVAQQALDDAQAAYNYLAGLPGGCVAPCVANLAGVTLFPGVYAAPGGAFEITGAQDLTLDAQGDANASFVFQMATSLTVGGASLADSRSIQLINGAQARNVYWQVGSAATINPAGGGNMVGTIISQEGVTISTTDNTTVVTIDGRALSLGASVTMVNTVINLPGQ